MFNVIKAVMWTAVIEFSGVLFLLWLISAIITAITLKSYGVRWWALSLLPYSHNACKLYFVDLPFVRWWYGLFMIPLGFYITITVQPVLVILYFGLCAVVNWLYGLLMYDEGLLFALVPPYRWYKLMNSIIEERRVKHDGKRLRTGRRVR